MNKKKKFKQFWNNGCVIYKNFISKKDIDLIFSQVNDLLNISLNKKIKLL
jgi:hypothetical protein